MRRFIWALIVGWVATTSANACSVPVFRFALERWQASPYEVLLFYRESLTAEEKGLLKKLESQSKEANVRFQKIDLAEPIDPKAKKIWEKDGQENQGAFVVLRYPDSTEKVSSLWAGTLKEATLQHLFDSPARSLLFDYLATGHTAVIVMVKGKVSADDEATRKMLLLEGSKLADNIELPTPTADGPQILSSIPLRKSFPIVEVERIPEEAIFLKQLLGSEEGLEKVEGPLVFPVFGRGRALCCLSGKDLQKPTELQHALEYLCKACSCQVKELNPGIDLLLDGNWEAMLDAEVGPSPRLLKDEDAKRLETKPLGKHLVAAAANRSLPPADLDVVEVIPGEKPASSPWKWPVMGGVIVLVVYCIFRFNKRSAS